jgi:hypothetical protein
MQSRHSPAGIDGSHSKPEGNHQQSSIHGLNRITLKSWRATSLDEFGNAFSATHFYCTCVFKHPVWAPLSFLKEFGGKLAAQRCTK